MIRTLRDVQPDKTSGLLPHQDIIHDTTKWKHNFSFVAYADTKHKQANDESDLIVVNVNRIPKTIKRSPKN